MSPLLISKFFNEHFVNLISQIYQARNSDTKKKKKKKNMSGNDDSHTDLVDIHFLFHLNKVNRKQLLSCDLRVAFGKRWFAKRATLSPFLLS